MSELCLSNSLIADTRKWSVKLFFGPGQSSTHLVLCEQPQRPRAKHHTDLPVPHVSDIELHADLSFKTRLVLREQPHYSRTSFAQEQTHMPVPDISLSLAFEAGSSRRPLQLVAIVGLRNMHVTIQFCNISWSASLLEPAWHYHSILLYFCGLISAVVVQGTEYLAQSTWQASLLLLSMVSYSDRVPSFCVISQPRASRNCFSARKVR